MSILPEYVIQQMLFKGLQAVREDPTFIDQLCVTLPIKSAQNFKETVLKTPIFLTLEALKHDTVLPCIAILPMSERETHPVVGDVLGGGIAPPDYLSFGDDTSADTITPASIDPNLEGQPVRIFRQGLPVDQDGAGYTNTYRLQIRTMNYFFTSFLYYLAKALLFRNKLLLEANGIQNLVISGGALQVVNDFLPDPIYDRTLEINFVHFFDLYTKAPVISSIDVRILELESSPEAGTAAVEVTLTATEPFGVFA